MFLDSFDEDKKTVGVGTTNTRGGAADLRIRARSAGRMERRNTRLQCFAGLRLNCVMDVLEELQSIPVEQRIALVEEDIASGKDRYRKIPAHELALVLGIEDSRHPSGDWSFTRFVERVSAEEYAELNDPPSEVLYLLEKSVGKERFAELIANSDELDSSDSPSFSFLSVDERAILENGIAKKELEGASEASRGLSRHHRYHHAEVPTGGLPTSAA